jgi:hypothetical protein
MKKHLWWSLALAGLVAGQAGAVEFFVPVPNLGKSFIYKTEFSRTDTSKGDVSFTYVAEGKSGLGLPASHYTVLPGPSTSMTHPLLTDNRDRDFRRPPDRSDPKWFLNGPGLVIMEGEPGLLGITTAVEIGGDPTSAWTLPMVTEDDAFKAGSTAYVLNLTKDANTASELSIFDLDNGNATCRTRLLSPSGNLVEERTNLAVPARGGIRIANIMSKITAAAGLSVAVSCDHPFYAMASFPAQSLDQLQILYPSPLPPGAGTAQNLVNNASFRVTRDSSVQLFELPLDDNTRYRSIVIEFNTTAASPTNGAFYRGLLGMWRDEPGQRFGKTLFFGVNERFDRSKLLIDLGTPYIEEMIKRGKTPFVNGQLYHFRIEVNADQQLLHQLVTKPGGAVLADMKSGLFNSDLIKKGDNTLIIGFGLPGIGDGAYSPPYGWRFANITITGYK